jgi:hypothetical protein
MEQGVEGELRSPGEVVALWTPGDDVSWSVESNFPRINPYAHGGFLVESLQIAVKALLAHHQPCLSDKILW